MSVLKIVDLFLFVFKEADILGAVHLIHSLQILVGPLFLKVDVEPDASTAGSGELSGHRGHASGVITQLFQLTLVAQRTQMGEKGSNILHFTR